MTEENKNQINWKKLYDYFLTIFYTLLISVTSGFGWFYIEAIWENSPLNEALFWSFVLSTGLGMVFMLSEVQNKYRKYEEEEEEDE